MAKQKNIPKLRFPEFKDFWVKIKLREISEKVNSGKTPLGGEAVYVNEGIVFIRSQNVINDRLELDNVTYIPEEIHEGMKNSIVKPNDILLNITGASLGRSCVVPQNFKTGNVNQHVCIIRTDVDNDPRFIQPILSSPKGQATIVSLQTGSGREGLNFESIKNFQPFLPSLPEQQKIASFLTVVDEKIQALKKKKELLEQYKKGVMQQIFSQKIRFKDEGGKAFPNWEEKRLGDLVEIKKGEQLNKINLFEFGKYPCINGGVNPSGYTNKYNSEENSITISEGGNSCGFVNIIKSRFWLGGHCYKIIFETRINVEYFYQLLKFNEPYIMNLRVGSGLPNIQQKDLRSYEISVTSCLEEQTKIANFLSAIDEKINIVQQQREQTELWKKGLLQQMLV